MKKKILMLAGPNGAGKTTMMRELIETSEILYEFINADEIAKSLAPLHPETMALTASKLMIKRLQELLKEEKSFAFETTGAGTNFLKHLDHAKEKGYEVNLFFLWLSSPEQAIRRVAQRVRQGGHFIPEEVVRRRYFSGLSNLISSYVSIANRVLILDNSSDKAMRVVAREKESHTLEIMDDLIWEKIEVAADGR